jgi:hypothetical protein
MASLSTNVSEYLNAIRVHLNHFSDEERRYTTFSHFKNIKICS